MNLYLTLSMIASLTHSTLNRYTFITIIFSKLNFTVFFLFIYLNLNKNMCKTIILALALSAVISLAMAVGSKF